MQSWIARVIDAIMRDAMLNETPPAVKKLSTLVVSLWALAGAEAADISIGIENLPAAPSRVFVAVYPSAEAMKANKPSRTEITAAQGDPTVVSFKDLPAGTYAFVAFADENSNGKLDTNLVGMPTERYGFSNNVMGLFGPPDFPAAAVQVADRNQAIGIKLR